MEPSNKYEKEKTDKNTAIMWYAIGPQRIDGSFLWPEFRDVKNFAKNPEEISPRVDVYDAEPRTKEEYAENLDDLGREIFIMNNPGKEEEKGQEKIEGSKAKNWYSVVPNLKSESEERKQSAIWGMVPYAGIVVANWTKEIFDYVILDDPINYLTGLGTTLAFGGISEVWRRARKNEGKRDIKSAEETRNIRRNIETVVNDPENRINPQVVEGAREIYQNYEEPEAEYFSAVNEAEKDNYRHQKNQDIRGEYEKAIDRKNEVKNRPAFFA